jgi:hypothetical protein
VTRQELADRQRIEQSGERRRPRIADLGDGAIMT